MAKIKNVPAITDAAEKAAKSLSTWSAVETHAKRILDATKDAPITGDFAELLFRGTTVQGVVKVGNVVLKIQGE